MSVHFGSLMAGSTSKPRPVKQERQILKVAVLPEPYFPKQKLAVRFNSVVLQHMELEDLTEEGARNSRSIAQGH